VVAVAAVGAVVKLTVPPDAAEVSKFTLEAAVVAPREVKIRFAAAPLPNNLTVDAPAVGVSAPRVSVVAAPEKPLNSRVPPAEPVVVFALKTTVLLAAEPITSEAAAVARSFSVPL
jgi:hypothetical protein